MIIGTMKEAQASMGMADVRWMPERHSAQRTHWQLTEWPRSPHLDWPLLRRWRASGSRWEARNETCGGVSTWQEDMRELIKNEVRVAVSLEPYKGVAGGGEQEGRPAW
jgi:hypothetical protein